MSPTVLRVKGSPHGFWLFVDEQELFVSFRSFPWFKDASIQQIARVELPSAHHLHWPDLDIDLAVDSLIHPERYPLICREQPGERGAPGKSRAASAKRTAPTPSRQRRGR